MRIIFFGTPPIAADIFKALLEQGVEVAAIVTKPDRPKGRSGTLIPPAVKLLAQEILPDVPLYQPPKVSTEEYAQILEEFNADLFVVVAYGEIISQRLLDIPSKGCINVHASLLPKYRGAAPIQRCLIEGETITGVTIMHMVKKMDAGDIIKTQEVPIGQETTAGELELLLRKAGAEALLDVIQAMEKGSVPSIPQNHDQATFAPKVELEDCEVQWDRPAEELHNLIRAVTPAPGAWCKVMHKGKEKRLKLSKTSPIPTQGKPGELLQYTQEGIVVACANGSLTIQQLQLEGKKMMTAAEFTRGVPSITFIS